VLQARKLHVRVLVDVHADAPPVWCDRTMVEQVLLNLARNGMQAMDQVPIAARDLRIGVRLRRPATNPGSTASRPAPLEDTASTSWVEFSVSDSGIGITPEVAQRIFTPFFTTKAQGMGLGLSLCRTVVEQHGGALLYEPRSTPGTVFRFTLPAAPG
jgi:two-component system sensor histidine kinase DctS